ncbi:MAG: amidohydrolase family protein, partial [Dehalococcoidia bacterium]
MASIEHLTGYITALQADDAPPIKKSRYSFGVASRHVDDTKIPKVAEATREAGTWNCVTLVVMDKLVMPIEERRKLLQSPEMRYVSPATLGMWDPSKSKRLAKLTDEDFAALRDGTAMLRKITRALHEGGARILLGTDCPNPLVVPGFAIHEELRNLVGAGLSPYEAIRAGTANAAEFLQETGEFGIVRTGARADLILLEANPLDDVANVQKRVGVMVRGKWLPEEELHRMLEETAASFAPKKNPFEGLADLPKEGTRLMKGRYEMLVGDAAFGYERIAVSHLESGESVIHAQMILTAWSRAETRTRLASGKSELGESLRIEYEAATGKTTLECLRQKGMLVLRGTVMGTAIDRSEPIEKEQILGTSSMAAMYLLAHRLRSLDIGDEMEASDKVVDLSPNLNFENRTRKVKREPDRPDGRRVYSIEGKGKSVKGQFRGSLVVDPSGLPVEYRIEQAMGTFVFRLIGE